MKQKIGSQTKILLIIIIAAFASSLLRLGMHMSGVGIVRIYNGLDTRGDSILIGCATAFLLQKFKPYITAKPVYIMQHVSLAVAGGLLAIAIGTKFNGSIMVRYGYLTVALLSAVIVIYLTFKGQGLLMSILANRWLVLTGKISYGLYLWHYLILRMLQDYYHVNWYNNIIFGIPLSYLVAILSFQIVEKRFLAIGKSKTARLKTETYMGKAEGEVEYAQEYKNRAEF